jgi:hypothetical protein
LFIIKNYLKMKRYTKNIFILFIPVLLIGIMSTSCNKETTSTPDIKYIRVTDPVKSDSLLTGAFLGNLIAIQGSGLGDVTEIWFNDQKAALNPAYVTSSSILVSVPTVIPVTVTNTMRLVYGPKDTMSFPFNVLVPPPTVASMVCEYVPDGGTAVIDGDYFVNDAQSPLAVIFPGNIPGEVQSVRINEVTVKVPVGVNPGPITVKSLYGSTTSKFYFRDNRNIILDFDNLTAAGGWRSGKIANSNPDGISGNYVRFGGGATMAGTDGSTWDEDDFSFDFWPQANGRPNTPVYSGDISNAAIKFECNVDQAWSASALQMIFTPWSVTGSNSYIADASVPRGLWIPWKATGTYTTNGWTTITIPLSQFTYAADGTTCANHLTPSMLYGLTFFVYHGGVNGTNCTPDICIDNIRVVPIN